MKLNAKEFAPDLPAKLENLIKIGYQDMDVSGVVSSLAGLPPMMPVFVNAGGTSMFLNGAVIEKVGDGPPFLRLKCDVNPVIEQAPAMSYEEQLDRQKQISMEMGRRIQSAGEMPEMVS